MKTTDRLNMLKTKLTAKALVDVGYPVFLEHTPVLTGNAKKHTSKTSSQINAQYPYAQRLNEGYSRKSPQGMSKPTIEAIRAYIRKV
jgi:hypothetical protein